ncbi:MAG: alpha/beta hydrolase [Deltaproteobacteria bacterium]|nr:alpha/beta hydrolase [Deltaproteobacteria bacterium]
MVLPRWLPALFFLLPLTGCTYAFYHPDHVVYYSPAALGLEVREIRFSSADGTKLQGWFFPAQNTLAVKGTIVQFHGNSENMTSQFASLHWPTRHGYNLFTFDYRGYGSSEGEPSQEGTYLDGMAALDKAWQLRTGARFVVIGQSLGGAIAMRSFADFQHQRETQLVVLDSTFASYKAEARRLLASHWYTWPVSLFGPVLISDKFAAKEAIARDRTRLLIVADRRDPIVSFANGEEIFRLARAPKDLWVLDQGRHIQVFNARNVGYRNRFLSLLEEIVD